MQATTSDAGFLDAAEVKRRHVVPKALVVGIIAGVVASGFRVALEGAEAVREAIVAAVPSAAGALTIILAAGGAALAAWLVSRLAPHAAGSGIPHLQSVLDGDVEPEWKRLLPVKFASGVIAIGSGLALGREGPTIQMGGAVGAMIARLLRIRAGEGERRALVSAGAGAGLAAAFNAPLSGLIFVLEELHGRFTPVMFVAAFLASVSADIVSRLLVSQQPVFHVTGMSPPGVGTLLPAAILGCAAGGLGVVFNRSLLAALDFRATSLRHASSWMLGAGAGAAVGLGVIAFPQLAGSGGALVQHVIAGQLTVGMLLVFLAARFVMTVLSYGTGAAGGLFAPLLVLGALGGAWFGSRVPALLGSAHAPPQVYCVLGMGALFTAIVRAPLTAIVLMIELTGEYGFMLPLLVSCLCAYGVAEALGNTPIYLALRAASGAARRESATEPPSRTG